MRLTTSDFKDQLYSLKASQKILIDEILMSMIRMNMELKRLSSVENFGKREQHMFYKHKPLEDIRT